MIYLLFDIGSTYTKAVVVDSDKVKILGTTNVLTSAVSDVAHGMNAAKSQLAEYLIGDYQTLVCSSAKGGLKIVAVGLVEDLTLKAAKLVCYSAGAKVVGSYSYKLNRMEVQEIEQSNCDIVVLCGGTDGGNEEVVLYNATQLSQIKRHLVVIYAGNKSCQDQIGDILQHHQVLISNNIMPRFGELQLGECQQLIRDLFLQQIIQGKGLSAVQDVISQIIMPTPSSVLQALQLLSEGTKDEAGIGELMAIDIGGATTDVYSINHQAIQPNVIFKGLPEPDVKRTVEGDLGLRHSAHYVDEQYHDPPSGMQDYLNQISEDISYHDATFDQWLARGCTYLASRRHAGRLETVYTPMGISYCQSGKDLRSITKVLGLGGPLCHAGDPKAILREVKGSDDEVLLPRQVTYYLDRQYVISCLGLLVKYEPQVALKLMKENIEVLL